MNSEGVYRRSEMLGVDLAKFLAPAVVFEVVVHHVVRHLPGTDTMDLENLQSTTEWLVLECSRFLIKKIATSRNLSKTT